MGILSLAVGIVVALAAAGGGSSPSGPQPWEPIRVVSASHQIDFPNEVVFTLEAEASSEITQVTLFYRLGRQKIRIYGYPSFTSSNHVIADFRVKTGGANFIPSGVDIAYHYEIRDSEGNTFETETFSLEYADPSYDWRRTQHGDLMFLWHDRPLDSVVDVARDVAPRLEEVKELFGLETVRPMKAVIINSGREAGRSFPVVSDAARRGHLYGGFAFGPLDLFVLVGLDRSGIVHEMSHLLLDEAMDSPMARVPAWLNEGLAMYFEFSPRGREATVSQAANRGRLLRLRSMGTIPGKPQDVRNFYAQSWSLVKHMMDAHGRERMAVLLGAINRGSSIEEAVPEAYGMSLDALEREWKGQFTGASLVNSITDPGTLGTSALIAGAVVVAMVAVIVRWLRGVGSTPGPDDTDP